MKKILILLSYLSLSLSLIAKDNDKAVLTNKTNVAKTNIVESDLPTDPLDLLLQRINNIDKLNPEDFLIDFQSTMTPGDEFHQNTVQFGGTDIYTVAQKAALYTKLNTFNSSQSAVKLFVITGRFMLGYRATTGVTASVAANEAKIINAMANKINSITPEQTDKKFIKDWISIWNQKRDSLKATNPKVLILFAIEGFFVDKNESLYRLESSGTLAIVDKISEFKKSSAYSLLNYGLPVIDWMKMNQTTVITSVRNALTGTLDGTKVNTAVDLITTAWGQTLNLTDPANLVSTINGLPSSDISRIPITDRKQFLKTLGTPDVTWKYVRGTETVNLVCEEANNAVLKILESTPQTEADDILQHLDSELSPDPINVNLASQNLLCSLLAKAKYGNCNNSLEKFVSIITKLMYYSTNISKNHKANLEEIYYETQTLFSKEYIGKSIYEIVHYPDNTVGLTHKVVTNVQEAQLILSEEFSGEIDNGGRYETATIFSKKLHPYDWVIVQNLSDLEVITIPDAVPPQLNGSTIQLVPAIFLEYLGDVQFAENGRQALKANVALVEIATLASGIPEVIELYRGGERAIAVWRAAQYVGVGADLLINTNIITDPETIDFIDSYNKIILAFTISEIAYTGVPTIFKASQTKFKNFKKIYDSQAAAYRFKYKRFLVKQRAGTVNIIDAIRKKFAKLDLFLARQGIKNIIIDNFYTTVDDFIKTVGNSQNVNKNILDDLYEAYCSRDIVKLKKIINDNNLNGLYPPGFGGFNTFKISLRKGMKFDRYQEKVFNTLADGSPEFTGGFFSPLENGAYSYEQRALKALESENELYYEIELLEDLSFNAEQADVFEWFRPNTGGAKQVKVDFPIDINTTRPKTLTKLIDEGKIKITLKSTPKPSSIYNSFVGRVFIK
jgi:hypothetical protein